jgi:hypothetical protein
MRDKRRGLLAWAAVAWFAVGCSGSAQEVTERFVPLQPGETLSYETKYIPAKGGGLAPGDTEITVYRVDARGTRQPLLTWGGYYDARATPDRRELFIVRKLDKNTRGYRVYLVHGPTGQAEFLIWGNPGLQLTPEGRYLCYGWDNQEELARHAAGKGGYVGMVRVFDVEKRELAAEIDFTKYYSTQMSLAAAVERFDPERNAFVVVFADMKLVLARFAIAVPSWEVTRLQ